MLKKIVASTVVTLLTSAGIVVGIASPAAAVGLNPMAGNRGFTVLSEGDAVIPVGGAETEGSWAVGGSLRPSGGKYSLIAGAHQDTSALPVVENKATRLLTAGTIALPPNADERVSVQRGDAGPAVTIGAPTPSWTLDGSGRLSSDVPGSHVMAGEGVVGAYPTSSTAWSSAFGTNTFETYRSLSDGLYGATGDGYATPTIQQGPINGTPLSSSDIGIRLVAGKVNVWNVTDAQFAVLTSRQNIKITEGTLSATTPLIINLPTSATVFDNPSFSGDVSPMAKYVLWNSGSTTQLRLTGSDFMSGAVLAPRAELVFDKSTPVEGQFVGKTVKITGSGEIHHTAFVPELPTARSATPSWTASDGTCVANTRTTNSLTINAVTGVQYTWVQGGTGTFDSFVSTDLPAGTYEFTAAGVNGYTVTDAGPFTRTFGDPPAYCDPAASASVSVTAPSCTASATLVLDPTTTATWGTPGYTPTQGGSRDYTVTATANAGTRFPQGDGVSSDGRTKTFTGTLPGQRTGVECSTLATPVEPRVVPTQQCGVAGTVTPVDAEGVRYEVVLDLGTGDYTVTATPAPGYFFDGAQTRVYSGNVGAYTDCVDVNVRVGASGECVYDTSAVAGTRTVEITYDNTGSTTEVQFSGLEGGPAAPVPAGAKATFQVTVPATGATFTVTAAGKTFPIVIERCPTYTKPPQKVENSSQEEMVCAPGNQVTITTITTTTDYVFDPATKEWIAQEPVVTGPNVTYRAMTDDEKSIKCGFTLDTDPRASQCTVPDGGTELTSWIFVATDPRVIYTITDDATGQQRTPVSGYVAVPAGDYTVKAEAAPGSMLKPDAVKTWRYSPQDLNDCTEQPPTQPDLAGSTALATCSANVPTIRYAVKLNDPDKQVTATQVTLLLTDGTNSYSTVLGDLVNGGLSGSIPWPGATADGSGRATGWPGWVLDGGVWKADTTANYGWTRSLTTATLSVNPSLVVNLRYPPATSECANPPFTPPTLGLLTPTLTVQQPSCTAAGGYTLGGLEGSQFNWTVTGPAGTTTVRNGSYTVPAAGGAYTFSAAPVNPRDGVQDWTNPQTRTFNAKPSGLLCSDFQLPTLAYTGGGTSLPLMALGLLLVVAGIGAVVVRFRMRPQH